MVCIDVADGLQTDRKEDGWFLKLEPNWVFGCLSIIFDFVLSEDASTNLASLFLFLLESLCIFLISIFMNGASLCSLTMCAFVAPGLGSTTCSFCSVPSKSILISF